ncbi:MAG: hypothetical protein GY790_19190 [Bacteroidetes bacterium]|nr:hypothetical protein [Bacteroidota bacterium]
MMKKTILILFTLNALLSCAGDRQINVHELKQNFMDPPDWAKPYVMWYWMGGNISRDGLKKDLDAMKEAGVGGAQIFNIRTHSPAGPVKIMSPEWYSLMEYAISYGGELGLDIALYNSMGGWSASGGPWVTPEMAMQELVWSEFQTVGGKHFEESLTHPPVNLDYYRDVAVIAFPTPALELCQTSFKVEGSQLDDPQLMFDGNRRSWTGIKKGNDGIIFLQLKYDQPFSAQSVSLLTTFQKGFTAEKLLCSNDGKEWEEVLSFKTPRVYMSVVRNFPQVTARYWRVEFEGESFVGEFRLENIPRITDWTAKMMGDPYNEENPEFSDVELSQNVGISKDEIIDLTSRMDPGGHLKWDVPEGSWTILRFGHTPTGSTVEPSAPEAKGLEIDKFSKAALDLHWEKSVQPWLDNPNTKMAIKSFHIDSYERYYQTWTPRMEKEFHDLRGYGITGYLPVLTGRIVNNLNDSERFLWDFRNTVTDLIHENYFGHMQQLCEQAGKQFSLEPYHQNQFNNVAAASKADIPMCEFWVDYNTVSGVEHLKKAASPAHVYGKPIIQCEALTARSSSGGNYSSDFWDLKPHVDAILCGGVNRLCFHVSVHQPWDHIYPGQSLAVFGTHFERTNTWWKQMPAFTKYISRSQYLLQQGTFVADVLYSVGENSPNESFIPSGQMSIPRGYDYDICDPNAILNLARVKNGGLVLPSGISYRLLVLPDVPYMTPEMIERIAELLSAGACIMAPKPEHSPSLAGQPVSDVTVTELATKLWGKENGSSVDRMIGNGRLLWGMSVEEALQIIDVKHDFNSDSGIPLRHIHKKIQGKDFYFLANPAGEKLFTTATFRVASGIPTLWNPLNGEVRDLPVYKQGNGNTTLKLEFEPLGSYFILFNRSENDPGETVGNFPGLETLKTIEGEWEVQFDPEWGGPEERVKFTSLVDWTDRPEEGIKYYSGTATYYKSFDFPGLPSGTPLYLDLGRFDNVAEVRLNGQNLGVVWCAPWHVEITDVIKAGGNQLEIDIISVWANRLIGDEQLPADCEYSKGTQHRTGTWRMLQRFPPWFDGNEPRTSGRYTFPTCNHWTKDSPLLPAGLLGPVTIQMEKQ